MTDLVLGSYRYLFDRDGVSKFRELYQEKVEPLLPLDKHGRKMFRAAMCYDGDKQYSDIQRHIRECILASMADIRESVTVGAVVGIERAEYDAGLRGRHFNVPKIYDTGQDRRLAPVVGSDYSICLVRCISGLNDWLNKQEYRDKVQYVIEAGCEHEEEATDILSRIADIPQLEQRFRWGSHRFVHKGPENPWLFSADYFAWEWQRNDRLAEYPDTGEWRTTILPLIEAKPHLALLKVHQPVKNVEYGLHFYRMFRWVKSDA